MSYGKQTEHISSGLSDTFQTTGKQGDFRPNHKRVMRNYPNNLTVAKSLDIQTNQT